MSMYINLLNEHQRQLSNPVLRYHFLRDRYPVSPEGRKKRCFQGRGNSLSIWGNDSDNSCLLWVHMFVKSIMFGYHKNLSWQWINGKSMEYLRFINIYFSAWRKYKNCCGYKSKIIANYYVTERWVSCLWILPLLCKPWAWWAPSS